VPTAPEDDRSPYWSFCQKELSSGPKVRLGPTRAKAKKNAGRYFESTSIGAWMGRHDHIGSARALRRLTQQKQM